MSLRYACFLWLNLFPQEFFCSLILIPRCPVACFHDGDEQRPGLFAALVALCSETQCCAPRSHLCLGLQVTSCLPVFPSSGTAGAINQLPLSPVVSVCSAWPPQQQQQQQRRTASSGLSLLWGIHGFEFKLCRQVVLNSLYILIQWFYSFLLLFFSKSYILTDDFCISLQCLTLYLR